MSRDSSARSICTVMLPARVDSVTAAAVETMLMSALRPETSVIIDGSEVVYMSAAGVRTLATVLHRAAELRTPIVFCRFSGPAADCLLVSGFSELFDVADSTAAATARLESRGRMGGGALAPTGAAG